MTVQNTAATGGSIAMAGAVLTWALGQVHLTVPADVAFDIVAIAAPVVHWVASKYGAPDPLAETPPPAPAPNPNPPAA